MLFVTSRGARRNGRNKKTIASGSRGRARRLARRDEFLSETEPPRDAGGEVTHARRRTELTLEEEDLLGPT